MPAFGAMLACTVIGIANGDTMTAGCDVREGKVNVTVRVAAIDAPEKAQPWGTAVGRTWLRCASTSRRRCAADD
jgi:endonuclease YncB( thermonuclease family)